MGDKQMKFWMTGRYIPDVEVSEQEANEFCLFVAVNEVSRQLPFAFVSACPAYDIIALVHG